MNTLSIQGTQEWLQMRKNYIGASDAPVIMEVSPYKTVHSLWEEKLGLGPDASVNPGMAYGTKMEEPARHAYETHTGILVTPSVEYHRDIPYMMASLDGLSMDKSIAVEIKNPCERDHEQAKNGVIPEKYFPQLQHQLAVLDIKHLHYFSYRQGDFALIDVERDDKYIDNLYKAEKKFWDMVINFQEPPLSEDDYVNMDTPEWASIASEWRLANEELKNITSREKELRQALIDMSCDKNARGCGVRLTKSVRKGAVDYAKIDELRGVDLEQYRKASVTSWRLS